MKCPKCQSENREGAKFCNKCGIALESKCPSCGHSYGPESVYCDECGHTLVGPKAPPPVDYSQPLSYTPKHLVEKILAARTTIEGERKQVTVLFADVKGFTSISEKLDPEDVQTLISECLVFFTEEIHRYEGTVAQFLGDGVMALFGAPIAHEDAPQRALYAALAIRERLREYSEKLKKQGIDFNMRIGLNTGLVVVGRIGDDLTMEYTAMGDTVNLASRMESTAEPGTIQVAENTYRLTGGYFEFKPLGEIEVKGKKEPVKVYQLLGVGQAKTRLDVSVARGLTPFVGREKEIEHLKDCYARVKEGQGQVVGIVGEPGVGKSRILLQLRSVLPPGEYGYLEGDCIHYGDSIAYLPFLDMLRAYFDFTEGEQESLVKSKMAKRIASLDEKLQGILPPLQDLLSRKVQDEEYLKLEPQPRREKVFEAIRALLIRESLNRPLILAIEDLHWIDKTSEEFLTHFIDGLANTHILLILLYRPEYTPVWVSKGYYSQIRVDQLPAGSSSDLVQAILEGGEVAADLRALILTRASGNPLFIEEFTHTLLERGYVQRKDGHYVLTAKPSDIHVPDTVQGIIAARIDRLEANLKRTMQVASVIGREFVYRILQTITGMQQELKSCMLSLQELEFIYEKSLFPELQYVFKHALTQEVAYNSLLLKRRREIHERIGQAIEEIYPDRLDEFYEPLAFHFKQAGCLDKAVNYLIKSGEKSLELYAVKESHRHFQEAFDILSTKPRMTKNEACLIIDMLFKWAYTFYFRGAFRELGELLQAYEGLARSMDDKERLGMFYGWLGFSMWNRGRYRDSDQYLREAIKLGEEVGSQRVIGYACCWLTWTCVDLGLLDEAIAVGERALGISAIYQSDQYLHYKTLGALGYAYFYRGEKKKAVATGQALLEYGRSHMSIRSMVFGHLVMALSFNMDSDYPSGIESCKRGIEITPDPYDANSLRAALAINYLCNSQFQEGEETTQQVVDFSREFGTECVGDPGLVSLAFVEVSKGKIDEGLANAEQEIQSLIAAGMKPASALMYWQLGKAYSLLMGIVPLANEKAAEHLNKAIEIAKEIGAKGILGDSYLDLGQLHSAEGDKDKARQYISEAVSLFEQCELDTYLKQAKEALESLK